MPPKMSNLKTISNMALKVLDAPKMEDDFYINVLDWSEDNILAIALHNVIYMWNGFT